MKHVSSCHAGCFLRLFRWKVSAMVGFCTLAGALLHGLDTYLPIGLVTLGSVLLCAGTSAFNQVQERNADALMLRTNDRPLPSGRITVRQARMLAFAAMLAGLVLFAVAGWLVLLLGVLVVAVYNGFYTPLKRSTPMAILVGGVAGALPPVVGWVAAGGGLVDTMSLCMFSVLYLWQVPHFWLLAEKHADDYERAGFAVAARVFSPFFYRMQMALWTTAFFIGSGLLVLLAGQQSIAMVLLPMGGLTVYLALRGARAAAFATVNTALLLAMAGVMAL